MLLYAICSAYLLTERKALGH